MNTFTRYLNLSRFALAHAGFRANTASPEERLKFWADAMMLEGLVRDLAEHLGGAMAVLGYIEVPVRRPDNAEVGSPGRIGFAHRLARRSERWVFEMDREGKKLCLIDFAAASNLLRLVPSLVLPKTQILQVLDDHVRLVSAEEYHTPDQDGLGRLVEASGSNVPQARERPIGGALDLLSGQFHPNDLDFLTIIWLTTLRAGFLNSSLLPNGFCLSDGCLQAPVGWTSLIEVPDDLIHLTNELIEGIAGYNNNLAETVAMLLRYAGAPTRSADRIVTRLSGFQKEGAHIHKHRMQVEPIVVSTPARCQTLPSTTAVLLLAQLSWILAALRCATS